jgi:hypothetical protein
MTQAARLGSKVLATARDRFEGSLVQSFVMELKALDFPVRSCCSAGGCWSRCCRS